MNSAIIKWTKFDLLYNHLVDNGFISSGIHSEQYLMQKIWGNNKYWLTNYDTDITLYPRSNGVMIIGKDTQYSRNLIESMSLLNV